MLSASPQAPPSDFAEDEDEDEDGQITHVRTPQWRADRVRDLRELLDALCQPECQLTQLDFDGAWPGKASCPATAAAPHRSGARRPPPRLQAPPA